MNMKTSTLSERDLDVLREIANVGTAHAATALSQMVKRVIMIKAPRAEAKRVSDLSSILGDEKSVVACVCLNILGDATGRILMILPRAGALRLAELLMKKEPGTLKILDEMGCSAIKEAGNILTGSYLTALSKFLKSLFLQTVPRMYFDAVEVVIPAVTQDIDPDTEIVTVRADFMEAGEAIEGLMILIPDPPSLESILKATAIYG